MSDHKWLNYRYYGSEGKSIHEKKDISSLEKGEVAPGRSEIWREDLLVPSHIPPTGLKGCNLMDLWYTIKLKVYPTGPLEKLETSTDVIIATVGRGQRAPGSAADSTGSSSPAVNDTVLDLSYFI